VAAPPLSRALALISGEDAPSGGARRWGGCDETDWSRRRYDTAAVAAACGGCERSARRPQHQAGRYSSVRAMWL